MLGTRLSAPWVFRPRRLGARSLGLFCRRGTCARAQRFPLLAAETFHLGDELPRETLNFLFAMLLEPPDALLDFRQPGFGLALIRLEQLETEVDLPSHGLFESPANLRGIAHYQFGHQELDLGLEFPGLQLELVPTRLTLADLL